MAMTRHLKTVPLLVLLGSLALAQPTKPEQDPLHHGAEVPEGAVGVVDGLPVTLAEFCNEMAARYTRPIERDGLKAVEALVDEYLITREMNKRGLSVETKEVDAQIQVLDDLQRKRSGKSLEEVLKENEVPMQLFRRKIRKVAGLDKLCHSDRKIPADKPVSNMHRKGWLNDCRRRAKIIIPPHSSLPKGIVAAVDGHHISTERFTREMAVTLAPAKMARVIEDIMQEKLILKLLAFKGLKLTEADLLAEWDYRKARFKKNPKYGAMPYAEMVKQQTGLEAHTVRASLGFRVNAAIGKIARTGFTPKDLEQAYVKHKDRYGPRLAVSHILIEATANELRQKTGVPSMEQGKVRAEYILGELEKGHHFEELVKVWSKDRATRLKSGRLPMFTPGRNPFERTIVDAAMKMQVGEISKPIQSRSGWHILKLLGSEPAPPLSDPEVAEDLRRYLARDLFTKAYQKAKVGIHLELK